MKNSLIFGMVIGILLGFAGKLTGQATSRTETETNARIKWYTIDEAVQQNKIKPRKIIVDLYTDWCGWCKVMDKNTFANDDIINYINKNYYPVKFNAETKDNIEFNNKVYSYVGSKGRGYNEFALLLTGGRLSYPTVVFIDEELNVIQPIQGYQEPKDFYKIMRFFGEDHYKKTPWNVFVQNYSKM
ncbi:MAG TPA: DUF255 domain-containing protein [Saprospiraceae bacterium]|nr:DUF255 domain-containing protein [Saprospiraceae bacterium]